MVTTPSFRGSGILWHHSTKCHKGSIESICKAIKKADAAVYDQLRMMVRPGPSDFDLKTDIGISEYMKMWTPGFQLFALRRDEMGRYVLTFIQMLHVSQARAILRDVISSNCQTSMTARGLSEDFA